MILRSCASAVAVCAVFASASAIAQESSPSSQQQPAYTFHAGTRVVLTDVVVTDRHGHPVHGLPQSAFQIYDNSKPQVIASFEEHVTTPVKSLPRISLAPGVYSNAFLEHLPPVLDIIVLDTTNLGITDQMYLNYQLTRFFKVLPPGQPVALYWRTGPTSFLLQNFTSDRGLLMAALHKALPHFPPTGRIYYSDFATLHQIAVAFGQYPGRKNILWFSGGSTLYLNPDPTRRPTIDAWRQIYDELETSRIAIYPIDARGLMVLGPHVPYALWSQHALMNDIAETTGGHAYYNTNGFGQDAQHWLDTSGDFYTITYSPRNFRVDNRWHKVKVKLTGGYSGYTLSYRRGYFADRNVNETPSQMRKSRTIVIAGGKTATVPDMRSLPMVFDARVILASQARIDPAEATPAAQAPEKKGTIPYAVRYFIPCSELTPVNVDGEQQVGFNIAAFVFDANGDIVTRLGTRVNFVVKPDKLKDFPRYVYPFDQRINLRKGQNYLYLAIWDLHSGRLGTLQVPFAAPR